MFPCPNNLAIRSLNHFTNRSHCRKSNFFLISILSFKTNGQKNSNFTNFLHGYMNNPERAFKSRMPLIAGKIRFFSIHVFFFENPWCDWTQIIWRCWQCAAVDGRKCPDDATLGWDHLFSSVTQSYDHTTVLQNSDLL